ncbi:hypothetical protein BH23CHL5_BH23CHL5_18270 [soil metagenome]
MSFQDEEAPEESNILPQDVASAARSCQAIIIMLLIIALLLCVSLVFYLATK